MEDQAPAWKGRLMNRRLLSAAFGATLIAAAVIPATTWPGHPNRRTQRPASPCRRSTTGSTRGMLADKVGNVMLELTALPVVVRSADARPPGRPHGRAGSVGSQGPQVDPEQPAQGHRRRGGRVLGQYQDAYNGIKVRVNLSQVGKLARLPGVKAVHAIQVSRDNTVGIPYIGVPATWGATGFTGNGVKIAIIDTGLDYTHADFGGSGTRPTTRPPDPTTLADGGFPTAKVAGGFDFAGDGYDATGDNGSTTPAPDPDRSTAVRPTGDGHGTHVAGTAAGQGVLADGSTYTGPYNSSTISGAHWNVGPGVAPKATLYSFKVFGCQGSTDLTVDAINAAVAAHVDVINMSLGSPLGEPSPDDPSSVASDNAAKAGVVVVASAGNSGHNATSTARRPRRPGSSRPRRSTRCRPSRRRPCRSPREHPRHQHERRDAPADRDARRHHRQPTTLKLGCDAADYRASRPAASRSSSAACAPSSTRARSPRRPAQPGSSSSTATTRIRGHCRHSSARRRASSRSR